MNAFLFYDINLNYTKTSSYSLHVLPSPSW